MTRPTNDSIRQNQEPETRRPRDENEDRPRYERARERRRNRVPVDSPTLHMDCENREGYFRYWFDDTPGRIQRALDAGYDFVESDSKADLVSMNITETSPGGKRISKVVGRNADGSGQVQYLMEIPLDWYYEDQAELLKHPKEIEQQIKTGKVPGDEQEDTSHRYMPGNAISIKHALVK